MKYYPCHFLKNWMEKFKSFGKELATASYKEKHYSH